MHYLENVFFLSPCKKCRKCYNDFNKKVSEFLRCTITCYFEPTNYARESRVLLVMSGHKIIPLRAFA